MSRATSISLILVVALFAVSFADIKKDGDKITIRTKRQQCVCVVVSQTNQQLQCSCDSNQPGGSQSGGGDNSQFPTPPPYSYTAMSTTTPMPWTTTPSFRGTSASFDSSNNPCACVQIVVSKGTSQYACDCAGAPQFDTTGSPSNGNNNNFIAQDQGNQNFLQSAITQADYFGSNAQNSQQQTFQPQQQQQQSFQPQQQQQFTTSGFQTSSAPTFGNQNQQQFQPMMNQPSQATNQNQNFLNSALTHSNFLGSNNFNNPQVQQQQPQQQQQTQNFGSPTMFQQDAPQQSQFDNEPATTTCITIAIPPNGQPCLCGNNYVQCADNMCCHKRYRSLKKEDESALDIFVDVLRNIKDRLDRS